jgi:hypothetical protein
MSVLSEEEQKQQKWRLLQSKIMYGDMNQLYASNMKGLLPCTNHAYVSNKEIQSLNMNGIRYNLSSKDMLAVVSRLERGESASNKYLTEIEGMDMTSIMLARQILKVKYSATMIELFAMFNTMLSESRRETLTEASINGLRQRDHYLRTVVGEEYGKYVSHYSIQVD